MLAADMLVRRVEKLLLLVGGGFNASEFDQVMDLIADDQINADQEGGFFAQCVAELVVRHDGEVQTVWPISTPVRVILVHPTW